MVESSKSSVFPFYISKVGARLQDIKIKDFRLKPMKLYLDEIRVTQFLAQ